ncbi:MAG: PEP-CTERM sorting domain-containing protein [Planctomycetota bacterium]
MQLKRIGTSILCWIGLALVSQAELVTLYDGSGLPASQPWLTFAADTLNGWSQTGVAGGVRLTTDLATRSGYSNYSPFPTPVLKNANFPALQRANGFDLSFRATVLTENHSSTNRAGYSVILLADDRRGIELGFWQSEIWAQNSDFTHAEGVAIDTTSTRDYRLEIIGDQYRLFEGTSSLLSGSLRTYTNPAIPYTLPNYVFLGDNTTSASAMIVQGAIQLRTDLNSVPEPSSVLLVSILGLVGAARWVHSKR